MKSIHWLLAAALLVALTLAQPRARVAAYQQISTESPSTAQNEARMGWWRQARFGMFIHWGIYAVPAQGEWYMTNARVPRVKYAEYARQFDPVQFDADRWARLAHDAGMRYLVITSKHHDGFSMFGTRATSYNVVNDTPWAKDPLLALSQACRKHGVRFAVYYSIMDWHSPDQAASKPDPEHPSYNPTHFLPGRKSDYIRYMKQELSELVTRYHPAILWFDGGWMADWTEQDGRDLYQYLRSLDPALIINNRVRGAGDYETPEQEIPATGLPGHDWETCMTINNSWGYNAQDDRFKSTRTLLHNLIDIASKGGNYLLNVGPTAEGLIPEPEVERLEGMGQWLKVNGEAIYGTSASPFRRLPFDGRCTQKPGRLYLHVFDWPADSQLLVPITNRVRRAYLLAAPHAKLAVASGPTGQTITLPAMTGKPDPNATVVAVEIEGPPQVIESTSAVQPAADGTLALKAQDADILGSSARLETRGDHPSIGYWTNAGDRVRWLAAVAQPGTYGVEATFACQPGNEGSRYTVSVGDQQVSGTVTATKDWDTFETVSLGQVHLDKPATYPVQVTPTQMPAGAVMNLRSIVLKPEG